jgi:hypothetical protein
MQNSSYLLSNQRLFKGIFLLPALLALLMLLALPADAQHRKDAWASYGGGGGGNESGYALTLNADYDMPTDILANTYKAAPAVTVGVVRYLGSFMFNANIGYHAYSPKMAVFTFDDGVGDTGTATYSNFSVLSVYAGAAFNLQINDAVGIYAGINWGLYATHYSFNQIDAFSMNSADITEQNLYFAPKLGFNYMLTDKIGLGFEAKYNFFSPEGSSDTTPDAGTVYRTYAAGLVLTYKL